MRQELLVAPELPHLQQFMDRSYMARLFEEHFRRSYPEHSLTVDGCAIEKVYYRLHKHCGALFRLQMHNGNGQRFDHWFFGKLYRPGEGPTRFAKAQTRVSQAKLSQTGAGDQNGFWRPLSLWSEMDLLIWAFPHDPKMFHLPEVVRPESVAQAVLNNAEALGLSPGAEAIDIQHHRVKYMPGKRCVLRFDIKLANPANGGRANGTQSASFFSKTYRDQSSRHVHEIFQQIHQSAARSEGKMEIPRPLVHIDDLNTYWQALWPGNSMSIHYGRDGWGNVLPAIAGALAAFHFSEVRDLDEAHYIEEVGDEAVDDAIWIGQFLPEDRQRVRDLAERIKELDPTGRPMPEVPAVPIHGAFRMSQLLGNEGRVAVIDLDAVALGDPHYDVAEFMTSITFQYFRRDLPLNDLLAKARIFRDAYMSYVPWPIYQRRLDWYTAAFLLEKFHGTLKGLQRQVYPKIDELYDLVDHYLAEASPD